MRIACSGLIALFALCFSSAHARTNAQDAAPQWSLAIHGGAGVIERASLTPEQDAAYRAALQGALDAGSAVLKSGGSALDAVQAAVQVMEDDPLFNAGRGAVFTAAGRNELDAAVMDGSDLTAGSVAGLTTTRHPVAAARAVMERSPHVMLIGPGADAFAASVGLEQVDPSFFFTERRWQGLVKAMTEAGQPIPERPAGAPLPGAQAEVAPPLNEKKFGTVGAVALDSQGRLAAATSTGGMTAKRWGRVGDVPIIGPGADAFAASVGLEQVDPAFFFTERRWQGLVKALTEAGQPIPVRPAGAPLSGAQAQVAPPLNEKKFGTVGAVALDSQGRLAAATSTGGMTAKRWGRVGDVPIIGAGTYASNADGCAVSATGDGEYFIRATVARDICARIAGGAATQAAGQAEIADADRLGGKGGVIVMGLDGRPAFAMSTSGMYRGAASSTDPARVAIYADEP